MGACSPQGVIFITDPWYQIHVELSPPIWSGAVGLLTSYITKVPVQSKREDFEVYACHCSCQAVKLRENFQGPRPSSLT
jgi:hypothetical protein